MPRHRTIPRICQRCQGHFLADAYDVKRGDARFCSADCARRRKRETLTPGVVRPDGSVGIPLRAQDGSIRAWAIVDASDADFASQWLWCLVEGYAARTVYPDDGRYTVKLHRALLGLVPGDGLEGDHISRDK